MYIPLFTLSLATAAWATPLAPRQDSAGTPCSAVSSAVAAQPGVATPTIPAKLAWDCLQSVPLNTSAAIDLIENVKPYVRWQSDTAFIANPPPEYAAKVQSAVDVWGGIADIESKLKTGAWSKEYEFGWALYRLLQTTHDGHFVFIPDSVAGIFTWGRPVSLVSVSLDGKSIPVPFVYTDIVNTAAGSNASWTASSIKTINGVDALEFLQEFSQFGSLQDRDALYNNVFYELAQVSLGGSGAGIGTFAGGGRGRFVYPGEQTVLEFENGTTVTYENFARVLVPFTGITSGEDIYQTYFTIPTEATSSIASVNEPSSKDRLSTLANHPAAAGTRFPNHRAKKVVRRQATAIPAPGYPPPVIRHSSNLIGGYYISDPAYSDIAVLSVPSFVGVDNAQVEFQAVAERFLAQAKKDGKKKLVVDVSANGGGTILAGYDLFKQLFPTIEPYGANVFRAHQSFDIEGQKYSKVVAGYPRDFSVQDDTILTLMTLPFNYRNDLDINNRHFRSWPQKYGPHLTYGDNFTSPMRWDLNDTLITLSSGGIVITGYQNRTGFKQPFAAEDIVIAYDGYCASTCTIFSEFMRQQAGVKTVALGGRPNTNIIQAVGGIKGTNNYGWSLIQALAQVAFYYGTAEEVAAWERTELADYFSNTPFYRAVGEPNVNVRDGLRKGDDSKTPLQFYYEPAECRIFYTPQMTVDVSEIWKAVADSAWKGKNKCVAGYLREARRHWYDDEEEDEDEDEGHAWWWWNYYDDKKRKVKRQSMTLSIDPSTKQGLLDSLGRVETDWEGLGGTGFMLP